MEEVELTTMQGKVAVTIKKKQNLNNKTSQDFSSAQWEETMKEYLQPVKELDSATFKDILDQAFSFAKKIGNKRQPIALNRNEASKARSLRTSLLDPVIGNSDDSDDSDSVPVREDDGLGGEPEGGHGDDGGLEYCG